MLKLWLQQVELQMTYILWMNQTKAHVIAKEDDIIFGSNDDQLSKNFATKMHSDFEMSLLGELT